MPVTKIKVKQENTSGIEPCGNKVLVKPDEIEEFTEGGILIPDQILERHEAAAVYGVVIAIGPDCFTHTVTNTATWYDGCNGNNWKPKERKTTGYSGDWVEPGDRIAFAIYAGLESTGEDGEKYKMINDEDITAKVSKNVTQTSLEARKPFNA